MTQRKRTFVVKPIYRVAELALMVGIPRRVLLRTLKRHGVELEGGGVTPCTVTLVALKRGYPDLWASIELARLLG